MFQYKSFLLKEWRQLTKQHNLIIIGLLLSFYPILQCFSYNPLLPIDFIFPYLISFIILYPCEFTSIVINTEFETKTYEILKVSNIKKSIIILSKMTLPILFSLIILGCSLFINTQLPKFTQNKIASDFLSIEYIIYCILSIIFSNLFIMYISVRGQTKKGKEFLTLRIAILFVINFITYFLYFINLKWLTYIMLIVLIMILFLYTVNIYRDLDKNPLYNNKLKNMFIDTDSSFIVLCKAITNNFWSIKKTMILVCTTIAISILIFTTMEKEMIKGIVILIVLFINCMVANTVIFQGVIKGKKIKIIPIIKVSDITTNRFFLAHVLIPIMINSLVIMIMAGINIENFLIIDIVKLLLMNLEICFLTLLFSFTVKSLKFSMYFQLFSSILTLIIMGVVIQLDLSIYFTIMLNVGTYLMCKYIYDKQFNYFFS